MTSKRYTQGVAELLAMTEGDLVGSVVVDQRYAKIQHEALDFKHPRGGQAKYLETPLFGRFGQYYQNVADSVLEDGGVRGMVKSVEDLSGQVQVLAPVDRSNLRRSGHPSVQAGGVTVYDRPPEQRRLTDEELKHRGRSDRRYGL